jgi:ABC-type Na+ efflux pump permease subunit
MTPATSQTAQRGQGFRRSKVMAVASILLLAAGLIVAGASIAPWPTVLALVLTEVGLAVWLARRHRVPLIGPLFFHDLVRLARRGRGTQLRCLYALALLAVLGVVYARRFSEQDPFAHIMDSGQTLPIPEMARFAETFVAAILIVQSVAVMVLTPAYLASAIAEEKERRSLDLLLTTNLSAREIVLGKLLARLAHVVGVLLTGLPVLALMQLWGGVDVLLLGSIWVVTALTLLSTGSMSILCSVLSARVVPALVSAYGILLFWNLCCLCMPTAFLSSPIAFLMDVGQYPYSLSSSPGTAPLNPTTILTVRVGLYALVHGLITLVCTAWATWELRGPYFLTAPPGGAVEGPVAAPAEPPIPSVQRRTRAEARPLELASLPLPVSGEPLLWKEVHHGVYSSPALSRRDLVPLGAMLFVGLSIGAFCFLGYEETIYFVQYGVNPVTRILGILALGLWCVRVAFQTATSVSRERDQGTLDSLLALPVDWQTILRAKWLGGIVRWSWLGVCLAVLWVSGLCTTALHPVAVVLLVMAGVVHLAFLASVGIWLSVVCRTTLRAQVGMALVLLALVGVTGWVQKYGWLLMSPGTAAFIGGLSPVQAWYSLAFSWGEFNAKFPMDEELRSQRAYAVAGLAVLGVAAWSFWRLACRRFCGPRLRLPRTRSQQP